MHRKELLVLQLLSLKPFLSAANLGATFFVLAFFDFFTSIFFVFLTYFLTTLFTAFLTTTLLAAEHKPLN